MQKSLLPKDCQLRPALATDISSIRQLVWSARLDPTQIRWSQFWVIEQNQTIIACGQLRVFPDAQELGSLVVKSPHRHQGIVEWQALPHALKKKFGLSRIAKTLLRVPVKFMHYSPHDGAIS